MQIKKVRFLFLGFFWLLSAAAAQQPEGSQAPPEIYSDQKVLLRCVPAKRQVFVGEPFTVTYQLLLSTSAKEAKVLTAPKFHGLNAEEVTRPGSVQAVHYQGKDYKATIIKQVILTADKPGPLVLEPLTLLLNVELPPDPEDFFPVERYAKFTLSSAAVPVEVLPLPRASSGMVRAVGKYKINSSVAKDRIALGDYITYQVQITGTGNVTTLLPPVLDLPASLEVYQPAIVRNRKLTAQGAFTSLVFQYQLVPTDSGAFVLPALPFTYFDTETRKEVTLASPRHEIRVTSRKGSPLNIAGNATAFRNSAIQKTKNLIIPGPARLSKTKSYFFGSYPFFCILLLAFFSTGTIWAYSYRLPKLVSNPLRQRKRKAWRSADQRLSALKRESPTVAYNQLSSTILNYLSDRLERAHPILTTREAKELLQSYPIPAPVLAQLQEIMARCYEASFAPMGRKENLRQLCHHTRNILRTIEKATK